jgi:hypothetical protein
MPSPQEDPLLDLASSDTRKAARYKQVQTIKI